MQTQAGPPQPLPRVRGLALPALLAALLASGRWQHPGDEVLREVLPWLQDPVAFLSSTRAMEANSQVLDMDADHYSQFLRVARGSVAGPVTLPWLDAELAVIIAVNRNPGDDIAIALDYRRGTGDPAVVATDWSDWQAAPRGCSWRAVAPTFEAFAAMSGIVPT